MNLSPLPIQKFFGNNGRPLVGGLLFTYAAGTSTKLATYTDSSGSTPNSNPVVLDFRGEGNVWLNPMLAYKFVLAPRGDTDPPTSPIWTVDNIAGSPLAIDNTAVDSGTVNQIVLVIPRISAPVAFTRVIFQATNTNTGPTTLQINGGTAFPLLWQSEVRFSGNEIMAGGIYQAVFDGGAWQLQGPTLSACDLRLFGGVPDGVTDCSAALTAASAASVAGRGDIVIKGGTYRLSSNVTIARGATISFEGGRFSIDSGDVLTIAGTLKAPISQIFSGSGTVSLTYGGSAAVEVWSEWWGAIPDGVTDCSAALNAALTCGGQVTLRLAAGTYSADNVDMPSVANSIVGVAREESLIASRTATWLLRQTNDTLQSVLFTLRDFTLDGGNVGTVGLEIAGANRFSIRDMIVKRCTSKGIYFRGSLLFQTLRVEVKQCPIGYDIAHDVTLAPPNSVYLRDGYVNDCTTFAIRVERGAMFVMSGMDIEANGTPGDTATMAVYIKDMDPDGCGIACVIKDCWFELNNGLAAIAIDKPLSSNSKHIIRDSHIIAGTRTSGVHVGGGSTPNTWLFLENVHAVGAATQDLLIGSNVFGTMNQCSFGVITKDATASFISFTDNNGNYTFGLNQYFMDAGALAIKDGITAPGTQTGFGVMYIDTADGSLKFKFSSGTVKVLATDP